VLKRFSFVFLLLWMGSIDTSFAQLTGWGNVYPGLNEEDIRILQKTARVDMDDKPEGTILKWNNPQTGSKGVVKLVKRFFEEGRECRKNQHAFRAKGTSPWKLSGTICRQADGSWQMRE
jgi:surface antigen